MTSAPVVEGPDWLRDGARVRSPLVLRQLPNEVPFGFLGRLLPTSESVELYLDARPIGTARAIEILHGARAVAEVELSHGGANDARAAELAAERDGATHLGDRVARREQELWRVGVRLDGTGTRAALATGARAMLEGRLSGLGFRGRVPRYEVRSALAPPDLTGPDERPLGFFHTLPTDGLAAFYPFVDEMVLEPKGTLVGLLLEDAAPVVIDRWSQASHSWGIFGMTGSGKSFAAALHWLRSSWMRPELTVTVLDPLGEFGELARALGGRVIRLGEGPGDRLNPLDPVTTGGDRREKAGRVSAMLRALFPTLRDEESASLDAVVSGLYARDDAPTPTFSTLVDAVAALGERAGRLSTLLEVFRSGSLRGLDGPTTIDAGDGPLVVDFRGVVEEQLPFHLTYVLDWAYGRLQGGSGPKMLIVDEAHLLARHPATAEFLDRVVRHVRHFGAGVTLLSQHPNDFLRHPTGRSLLGNLSATLLLRLPPPDTELASFYGLTDAEAEWLPRSRLPREAGYSEGLLRVGELHLPIAVVASTPEYEFLVGRLAGAGHRNDGPDAPPTPAL
ncbi:MAG: VirB4 family type IV secretion system protein [Thermoplasmata archaeon]